MSLVYFHTLWQGRVNDHAVADAAKGHERLHAAHDVVDQGSDVDRLCRHGIAQRMTGAISPRASLPAVSATSVGPPYTRPCGGRTPKVYGICWTVSREASRMPLTRPSSDVALS